MWGIAGAIPRIFGIIASKTKGRRTPRGRRRTPKIQFIQYRLEGVIAFVSSLIFINSLIYFQSNNNILFNFDETFGSIIPLPVPLLEWLAICFFIMYNFLCFADDCGPYKVWFTNFRSLSEERKKKLLSREW